MRVPKQIHIKINNLKYGEAKELAEKKGNIDAFNALFIKNDLKLASDLLGLSENYRLFGNNIFNERGEINSDIAMYLALFKKFLVAKICFPDEFEISEEKLRISSSGILQEGEKWKDTPIYIPPHIKEILLSHTGLESEALAKSSGNLEAYRYVYKDFEKTSELLGVQNALNFYLNTLRDSQTGKFTTNLSSLMTEFRMFLLAKCCFPNEF